MIRGLDSMDPWREAIPEGWQRIPFEGKLRMVDQVYDLITKKAEVSDILGYKKTADVVEGFEDLLHEPLGQGYNGYFNTGGTVFQLAFALSLSQSTTIPDLIKEKVSSKDAIQVLRQKSVLKGLRITDLGCSPKPTFALAARSLGAEVYTADAQNPSIEDRKYLSGHTVIDLSDERAPEVLAQSTGGNMDLVTENIRGRTHSSPPGLKMPKPKSVLKIADVLLKQEGYLYSALFDRALGSALQKTQ